MASPSIQQSLESYKTTSSVEISKVCGGDGIGLAIVKAIVEFGGHVAVIGQREIPHADLREIQDSSGESSVRYFRADVANESLLNTAFDQILAEFGRIDGVVACAGICVEKPFVEQTWEEVVRLHMVNSVGLFFLAPEMQIKSLLLGYLACLGYSKPITEPGSLPEAAPEPATSTVDARDDYEWGVSGSTFTKLATARAAGNLSPHLAGSGRADARILSHLPTVQD
ncbi:hypothetical protein BDV12DRAFT_201874 [Aspergillus spectabilis]